MITYVAGARDRLQVWFDKAENWQKDLFINIWNGGMSEDEILARTIKLIEQEYLSENHRLVPTTKFPSDISFTEDRTGTVQLASISDIKGVGALAPKKPLCFGEGLTVVYGDNGCGKSSYVRILKALANPVNADAVLGNVYLEDNVPAEATVTFSIDGEEQRVVWTRSSKTEHPIQIYDTIEADRFVNQKNEVVFEPKVLATISQMASIYDLADAAFADKIRSLECEMGKPSAELRDHPIIQRFKGISTGKQLEAFTKTFIWSEKLREELTAVLEGLQESDPKKAEQAKVAQRDIVRNHGYAILKILQLVSDEAKNEYLTKRERQIATKKAADTLISTSRDQSLLGEFGCDAWQEMWTQAVAYVRQIEGDVGLPITESGRCALCQQEVDAEALERVKAFKMFSEAAAMKEATCAASDFEAAVETLQNQIENKINISELNASLKAGAIPTDVQTVILSFYQNVLDRCSWLLSYCEDTANEIPYIGSREEITASIKAIVDKYNLEIVALQEADANRGRLVERELELRAIQWACGNLAQKRKLVSLSEISSKCKTNSLTTLKKDLSKLLITDAYIQRFQEEMNCLDMGGQIKVELVANAPQKGKSYHQVSLKGARSLGKHKNNEILSEGEFRVVSLASFLADLSSWHRNRPFVFDDPITSLDHRYEKNVADRLVQLSTERQVIVFTHRLAFAQLLQSAVTEFNVAAVYEQKTDRANVTHIELRNAPLGEPSIPRYVEKMKLADAIRQLLGENVVRIKKLRREGDYDTADTKILELCTIFRNVIEYGVEQSLLSGIVSRFGRNVLTLKLPCLYAITQEDIALFDSMMTKYSYYDHSHSLETPIPLPDIADVEADMQTMLTWDKEFTKRCKTEQDKSKGKK